ncbi:phage tail protein [Stenotrophomonas sp. 278]|uniref:phage tail protein n=1 Tax=Stenotrophomonas sp. 278 TaxID=2479851 RepID=UPI000F68CDF9|nr:phage tail protein [Stenotrophomonas sp. 278]RRU23571.1 phage tail protein [Stenotrophomonas sp. 278]
MAEEFTWCVRTEINGTGTFSVREAKFGDGYSQAASEGINNEEQQWPISIVGRAAKVQPALEFIRAHQGARSFLWTPPLGAQGLYRCKTYNLIPHGNGVFTLNATFEQTFQP